jgi:hypothetical protein
MSDDTPSEEVSRVTYPLPSRNKAASTTSPPKKSIPTITLADEDFEESPDPIQKKAVTQAETDPNYISVDLPSKFYFYGGLKTLSVSPVKGSHQAKFHRAAKLESTKLAVEAVTSLLGDNVPAEYLTTPDFFWLLYYLRVNFYPENSLTYRAICMNPTHLSQVQAGEKTQESLVTVAIVKKSELKESLLSKESISIMESVDQSAFNALGYKLTAPRMKDSIELEELVDLPDFQEIEFLADYAGCLARLDGEWVPLTKRIETVRELTTFQIKDLETYLTAATNYGVEETVSTRCKECGAVVETEVSITAHDFL